MKYDVMKTPIKNVPNNTYGFTIEWYMLLCKIQ